MNIESYGYTNFYGYGTFSQYSGCDFYFFDKYTDIYMEGKTNHHTRFYTDFKPIYLPGHEYRRSFYAVDSESFKERAIIPGEPLFLVYVDKIWREYFTGCHIKVIEDEKFSLSPWGNNIILSYVPGREKKKSENHWGKELFLYSDGEENAKIHRLTPQEFDKKISKYTEDEIKNMVDQFYDLQEKAKKWGERIYEIAHNLSEECAREIESIYSSLENGFGTYARK